jgi:hypothetical protein
MDMDADVAATNLQRIGEYCSALLSMHNFQSLFAPTLALLTLPAPSVLRALMPNRFCSSHVMGVVDRISKRGCV